MPTVVATATSNMPDVLVSWHYISGPGYRDLFARVQIGSSVHVVSMVDAIRKSFAKQDGFR